MTIKRKFGDRADWQRVSESHYTQAYVDSPNYRGYVTLLSIEKATQPLWTKHNLQEICIVDNGYVWLQHFPENQHHSVTTVFDQNGDVVQWYIDICLENGLENNRPFMDDLFLDIILLPSGLVIEKDKDEIEEALSRGVISEEMYDLAWREFDKVRNQIRNQEFKYTYLSKLHKESLASEMKWQTSSTIKGRSDI